MRNFLFFIFKIFKRIENSIFYKRIRDFLLRENIGQDGNRRINTFYRKVAVLKNSFSDWMYNELKPKGIVLINILGNKMYVDTDDKDIAPKLLMNGFREERYETILFQNIVKEGMVVVDIGANIGYYTLIGARLVDKSGIVYAFEPLSSNYELLCKNIKINNYTNVVPVRKVISNKHGKAKFWFEKDWRGSPSLSKHCVLTVSKHELLEKGGFVEAETISLDDFFESTVKNTKVDVIKVDTGGAEGLVIEGSEKILRSNDHLKIFLEFWPDALRDLGTDPLQLLYKLQKYGFEIKFINEAKQALEPIDIKKCRTGTGFNLLLEK